MLASARLLACVAAIVLAGCFEPSSPAPPLLPVAALETDHESDPRDAPADRGGVADARDVRAVVGAIAKAARENREKPEPERTKGDALTDLCVRAACGAAVPPRAVLFGMGYALDEAHALAKNPLFASSFRDVESPAERAARVAALRGSTLRGRTDWLSHFVVSGALAAALGGKVAEEIGIQKELTDAHRKEAGQGSGFSFADLGADFAGVAFAQWLLADRSGGALRSCAAAFEGARFMPDATGWLEDLTATEFEAAWGGVKDARFEQECARMTARVRECEGYLRR